MYDAIYAFSCRMQNIWRLCIHIRIFISIFTCKCVYENAGKYVYENAYVRQMFQIFTCMCLHTCAFLCAYLCACVLIRVREGRTMTHLANQTFIEWNICLTYAFLYMYLHATFHDIFTCVIMIHMYVFTCIFIYIYISTFIFIYIYIYMHFHLYIYMRFHIYIFTCIFIYKFTCIFIYTYLHASSFTYLHTCVSTNVFTTHVSAQTCAETCARESAHSKLYWIYTFRCT